MGRNAPTSLPCGTCSSSTIMVMMMASTPSLNASTRLFDTSPVYLGEVDIPARPVACLAENLSAWEPHRVFIHRFHRRAHSEVTLREIRDLPGNNGAHGRANQKI